MAKDLTSCEEGAPTIDVTEHRYPFCLVWRPIRVLTWIVPFLGHVGIGMSDGVIRDFADSYEIKIDEFDRPAKYLRMDPSKVTGGAGAWDEAIESATSTYGKQRLHPPFFDNCYSYVGYSLNAMQYDGNSDWHMGWRSIWLFWKARYNGFYGFVWIWLPFFIVFTSFLLIIYLFLGGSITPNIF